VPALFWVIRVRLGKEATDRLVWNSIRHLGPDQSYLRIPEAILESAREIGLAEDSVPQLEQLLRAHAESFRVL
jgi:hypothetical protein